MVEYTTLVGPLRCEKDLSTRSSSGLRVEHMLAFFSLTPALNTSCGNLLLRMDLYYSNFIFEKFRQHCSPLHTTMQLHFHTSRILIRNVLFLNRNFISLKFGSRCIGYIDIYQSHFIASKQYIDSSNLLPGIVCWLATSCVVIFISG